MLFDDPALKSLKKQFDSNKERVEGVVKATDRGFGFLEFDKESIFIAPNDMKKIMQGDRISAVVEEDAQGRKKAVPEKLLSAGLDRFIGNVLYVSGKLCIIPEHPSISVKIGCTDKRSDKSAALNNGDFVVCRLTSHALEKNGSFRADITELVCRKTEPKAPWLVSLRRYDLPLAEPADAEFSFLETDLPRQDLTSIPFVTIDSEHTEDMDDALYVEKTPEGYILYTSIADPTGYIAEGSEIDRIAQTRGFSIYLPGKDIPMLPRILSEDLCSLRQGENRPSVVGKFYIGTDGAIDFDRTEFCLATVCSHGKLSYNAVSDYLEGKADCEFKPDEEIASVLKMLVELTNLRHSYRSSHAADFINKPDYDFVLTQDGALDHIEVNHRRISNLIVEECMIASNIAAGEFLSKKLNAGIFNTHKGFDLTRKKEILELLKQEQYPEENTDIASIAGYNAIRRFAISNQNFYMDARVRKLQEYSQISIVPAPHYALGVENYATWTSPIRKYGDMINHRLIKSIIVSSEHPKMPDDDTLSAMNTARRTNRMAERDVKDWLYVDYLRPEIEKKTVFTAELFDVSRGGLRAFIKENGAMAFIPFSYIASQTEDLQLDSDAGKVLVKGETELKLADEFKVRVVEVESDTHSITAAPAEPVGGLMLPDIEKLKKEKSSFSSNGSGGRRR
ncbi:MAG: exoribonuclease II [Succinivibrio sp.]|nr:exoribonuclease II [Succinivibrio sp.]